MDSGIVGGLVGAGLMRIFQLHVMDSPAPVLVKCVNVVVLSTPCNGFGRSTWRWARMAKRRLSTPCNGFTTSMSVLTRGKTNFQLHVMDSGGWLERGRGAHKPGLSTPCNGFPLVHVSEKAQALRLSTPCNGFM